jgi:hypothetical protein
MLFVLATSALTALAHRQPPATVDVPAAPDVPAVPDTPVVPAAPVSPPT